MAAKCPECRSRFIQIGPGDDVPSHTKPGQRGVTCDGSGETAVEDD